MKSCEEMQELISRLLDEELSGDERSELEQHLASCPDCRAMYDAFRALSDTIGEDLEDPPVRLHETVMADVRREALRRRQAPRRVRTLLAVAACAALVLLGVTNLPRMGSSAPMTAASQAIPEAAMSKDADDFVAFEAEEAAAGDPAEPLYEAPAAALYAADRTDEPQEAAELPDEGAASRAEAPEPMPMPEPEAAPAAQEPAAGNVSPVQPSLWPYALIGLPLIAAVVLLLLRGKGRG